jgi:DNA-binding NtrC family response regulator
VRRLEALARTLLRELELAEHEQVDELQSEVDFYEEVKLFEIGLIRRALAHSVGHQVNAARFLRLNPSTLNAKIKQYRIHVDTFSDVLTKGEEVGFKNNGRQRI